MSFQIGQRVAYVPLNGNSVGLSAGDEGVIACGPFLCDCGNPAHDRYGVDFDAIGSGIWKAECLRPIDPKPMANEDFAETIGWKLPTEETA